MMGNRSGFRPTGGHETSIVDRAPLGPCHRAPPGRSSWFGCGFWFGTCDGPPGTAPWNGRAGTEGLARFLHAAISSISGERWRGKGGGNPPLWAAVCRLSVRLLIYVLRDRDGSGCKIGIFARNPNWRR